MTVLGFTGFSIATISLPGAQLPIPVLRQHEKRMTIIEVFAVAERLM